MRQTIKINLVKAAIAALVIKVMFSASALFPWNAIVDNLLIIFALVVLGLKILKTSFSLKQFGVMCFFGILILYTCVQIRQYDLLITLIAVYLLKDEKLDEYIHLIFRMQVIIIIIHFLLSGMLSLLGNFDKFWIVTDTRLRFNGGFTHPNVLSAYILSCMMMYAWRNFEKMSLKQYLSFFLIAVICYLFTKSRTSFLLDILLITLIILSQSKRTKTIVKKITDSVLKFMFPFLSICMYIFQTGYLNGNAFILAIDDILSGRVKYAAYAYQRSGMTLLPRYLDYAEAGRVEWNSIWNLNTFTFDNIYSFLFMQMGIVWLVIICVMIWILIKRTDFKCNIFILIWILFSMTEVHGMNCFKFFPIILLNLLCYEKGGIEKYATTPD